MEVMWQNRKINVYMQLQLTTVSLGDYLILGGYFSVVIPTSQCTSLVIHNQLCKTGGGEEFNSNPC